MPVNRAERLHYAVLTFLALSLVAPSSGLLAVDGLGVGLCENGKWRAMDSMYSQTWPKQLISKATVEKYTAQGGYTLGARHKTTATVGTFAFGGDDQAPGDRGWILQDRPEENHVIWFGAEPKAPKVTFAGSNSATYFGVVKSFLATKGIKNAKPKLGTVVLADLDGNGTQEALIFASSRSDDEMRGTFTLEGTKKFPNDYSVVLIRSISGKSVKTTTVYYADGRKGSLDGHCTFAGLWNVDGKPGLEIIHRWEAYEGWAATVLNFSKGKVVKLAEAGDGV